MNHLRQFGLVLLFSLLGELCRFLIPFPIPASIYGMVLLFAAMSLKIVKSAQVRDAGGFLTSVLPVLFVAPAVNLIDCWDQMRKAVVPLAVIVLVSTVLTFGVSGVVTKWFMKGEKGHD